MTAIEASNLVGKKMAPPKDIFRLIRPGNIVKIMVDATAAPKAEFLWTWVMKREGKMFYVMVLEPCTRTIHHGLVGGTLTNTGKMKTRGSMLSFQKMHILDVLFEQPEPEKGIKII